MGNEYSLEEWREWKQSPLTKVVIAEFKLKEEELINCLTHVLKDDLEEAQGKIRGIEECIEDIEYKGEEEDTNI